MCVCIAICNVDEVIFSEIIDFYWSQRMLRIYDATDDTIKYKSQYLKNHSIHSNHHNHSNHFYPIIKTENK